MSGISVWLPVWEVMLHGREMILTLIVINFDYTQKTHWMQAHGNLFLCAKWLCLLTLAVYLMLNP